MAVCSIARSARGISTPICVSTTATVVLIRSTAWCRLTLRVSERGATLKIEAGSALPSSSSASHSTKPLMPLLATMVTHDRSSAPSSAYQGCCVSISAMTALLILPAWAASRFASAFRLRLDGIRSRPAPAAGFVAI